MRVFVITFAVKNPGWLRVVLDFLGVPYVELELAPTHEMEVAETCVAEIMQEVEHGEEKVRR